MQIGDEKKQASLDVAEDARPEDTQQPSFVSDLFKGEFNWGQITPFPIQTAEEKKIGDDYMALLKPILEEHVDASEVDRTGKVSDAAIQALKNVGAFGLKISRDYGGIGLSQTNYSRVCAYIGSYCASTGSWVTAHQSIGVAGPLKLFGSKAQKDKYLPQIAAGAVSAFGLTEPGVGSDPADMQTMAELSEDGKYWIVNGEKLWITNGPAADVMILMARTPDKIVNGKAKRQISAFVFETKDAEGYHVVHNCEFMGIRGIENGLLRFRDVKIPAENIIGKTGDGLKIALVTLVNGRLSIPATSGAGGKSALAYSAQWAAQREQWGAPIGKHQNSSIKIANFAANTMASEAITWLCCGFADDGNVDIRIEAAMAKYFCTEVAWKMADDFLQIRGGRGFETAESLAKRGEDPIPAEKFLRDCRIARIVEGTSEIMKLYIAREAMDTHVKQIMPLMMPGTNKMQHMLKKFIPFYATWLPKQYMPAQSSFKVQNLDSTNQRHLAFIAKHSKRLARTMFFSMAKYQQRLEREQLIMSNFVDIGTDLFAMSAILSYTDGHLGQVDDGDKQALQELCDLFCSDARDRIADNFKAVKKNHNKKYSAIAKHAMANKYEWLCEGTYKGISPGYLKFMNQSLDAHNAKHNDNVTASVPGVKIATGDLQAKTQAPAPAVAVPEEVLETIVK